MKFAQKRLGTNISFDFADTELTHAIRDKTGERDAVIDYAEITLGKRRVFETKEWYRNVGVLWCIIGLASIGFDLYNGSLGVLSGFWLVIGGGCLIYYFATKTSYTVIETQNGALWIMEDKQHPQIVAEIEKRRKARLLDLYGALNLDNDADQELAKIEWLVKQKVLTRAEADLQAAQIRSGNLAALPSPEKLIN